MKDQSKTFGQDLSSYDPLSNLKRESIDRMKMALLSSSLDDPLSVVSAVKGVTVMRVYHQVVRIVQYLDLMDRLEAKLYYAIDRELENDQPDDYLTISRLLKIQEQIQKSIIESNKLLAPYLEMEQYQTFNEIEEVTPVSDDILELDSTKRNLLRENAGQILSDLQLITSSQSS